MLILAEDEGRFGRISVGKRCWAPPHRRPTAPRQVVREYLYAFVAVCPSRGTLTALILPWADTEMMNLFLRHLSDEFRDYFLLLLMDQAGWHVSNALQVPENIRLIPFPPHSPELNPAEHVWEELREKHFHNRAFASLDEVEEKLCAGLISLSASEDRVRSLTGFPYLNITF